MRVNWMELTKKAMKSIGHLARGNEKIMDCINNLDQAGTVHGALHPKTRELVALAVASTTRCDTCIALHARAAAEAGATREELLEVLGISVGLNAGAAIVSSSKALEAFDSFKETDEPPQYQ